MNLLLRELESGEVLLEQARAYFYAQAEGDLALTDRRILFRANWGRSGELGLTVPLSEIRGCVVGRRLGVLGREVRFGLQQSSFLLRFRFVPGSDSSYDSVVAAVQKALGESSSEGTEWRPPLRIELGEGVVARSRLDGLRPIHVWCDSVLGGLGFVVRADLKRPKGIEFSPPPSATRVSLLLSPELLFFNELRVTTKHEVYWAATPARDDERS